ncbi:MAG: tripartite tricarboxylate transporter substrate binding protein [Betaproteobacteria bacterium]
MMNRRFLMLASALALSAPVLAQNWPSAPVTLLVGFAPGGSTDIAARVLAEQLGKKLGQNVVVVNRPGASGVVGANAVAIAKPDGQTFLFGSGSLASGPSLNKSLPFDTGQDFVPVAQITSIASILAVHPSLPVKNVKEFVDYVKANPGKLNYGSAGAGSLQHVSGALFEKSIGGRMVHVPYAGGAPANTDLVAGRVQAVFGPIVELAGFYKSGAIRVLGVTSTKRSSAMPDVAPIAESVPGYDIGTWHGLFAPKGTPAPIVDAMSRAMAAALAEPAVRSRLLDLGLDPVGSSPQEFSAFFQSEIRRWRELVQISGAAPN